MRLIAKEFLRSFQYTPEQKIQLVNYFSKFLTPSRFELMHHVLNNRSKYMIPVVEDIYKEQNLGAIMRTAECFGCNNLFEINNNKPGAKIQKGHAKGADEWLEVTRFTSTEECCLQLKEKGYRIIITSPYTIPQLVEGLKRGSYKQFELSDRQKAQILARNLPHYNNAHEVPIFLTRKEFSKHGSDVEEMNMEILEESKKPIAIVFGNESNGISERIIPYADATVKLPMYGFTESFNIHASFAIIGHVLNTKFREALLESESREEASKYLLSEQAKVDTLVDWVRNNFSEGDKIEYQFLKEELGIKGI
ncbi:hypothetical protein ABK040_011049 [Willaertia magna]